MIDVINTFLLTAHLLCVNLASGGPIVGAWLDWRGSRGDESAAKAARFLGSASLIGLLIGALLGVSLGWLKWNAEYASLWRGPMSYKLHWAIVEALFSLFLMLGWWLSLPQRAGGRQWTSWLRSIVALLAATNLLYHFPILFSVAAQQFDAGQTAGPPIRGAEFRRLMLEGQAPSLWLHVTLASIAVAGTVLLALPIYGQKTAEAASTAKLARWGGRWALIPSLVQLPVGLWTLTMLPQFAQSQVMGGSTPGTLLLFASLAAALWLLNELVHASMGETARSLLQRAVVAMLVTVTLMTALQQNTRAVSKQTIPHASGESP